MNTIYSFDFKDKHYDVKVNMKVRLALNNYIHEKERKAIPEETIEELQKIDFSIIDTIDEEDGIKELSKYIPLLTHISALRSIMGDDTDSQIEVFKLILVTLYSITNETFEEICDYLEEKEGSLELCEIIGNIYKEAFIIVEQMNKALSNPSK